MNKIAYVGIGLILGVLVGFGIGFSIQQDSPADIPAPPSRPEIVDAKEEILEPVKKPEVLAETEAPASKGTLSDLIANADVPEIPSGTGVITGRILTKEGKPVAGVEVVARPTYPDSRKWSDKNTEERVLDTIRYERWHVLSKRIATTDEQGSFQLKNCHPTKKYRIRASLDGWKITGISRYREINAGEEIEFLATRIFTVYIEGRLPDGSLAGDFNLSYKNSSEPNRGSRITISNGQGEIEMGRGEYTFSGPYGSDQEYGIEKQTVTIGAKPTITVILQLKVRAGIKGTVAIPTRYQDTSLQVFLVENPPAEAPTKKNNALKSYSRNERVWNEEGQATYQILDVKAGKYRVILLNGIDIVDWKDITIGETIEIVDLVVREPNRDDYIIVTVTAPDGSPLKDVSFSLTVASNNGSSSSGVDVVAGENNEYWIRRSSPNAEKGSEIGDIEEWRYELRVSHRTYGSIDKTFEHDDQSLQEYLFQEAASVKLVVSNHNDHEQRTYLHWSLRSTDGKKTYMYEGRDTWNDEVDEKRNKSPFIFGLMQPGNYQLILTYGGRRRSTKLYQEEFELRSGENNITASIPQIYSIKVKCSSNREARRLGLEWKGKRISHWSNDNNIDDDTITFKGLVAGEYVLENRIGRMKITVPTSAVIDFTPRAYDCIVISDIKEGGTVEGLGLRNQDKLIEIDGTELTTMKMFSAFAQQSLLKESTTWVVLRNGMRTEVTFNGLKMMQALEDRENDEDLDFDPGYRDE